MYFDFYYSIDYDARLDYDDMSTTAITLARVADKTTNGNRSKWGLFIQASEVGVGFDCAAAGIASSRTSSVSLSLSGTTMPLRRP